jgi:Arc/MetJ-type ribon-helix-helix transcriptional regulator
MRCTLHPIPQENQLIQTNQLKPKRRAIILRLPEPLIDRLDSVASDLRMPSRSHYIRRSIERALEFSEGHELPLLQDPALQRALAR